MILLFLAPSSLQYVISTRSDSGTFTTRRAAPGVYYNGAIYVIGGLTGTTKLKDVMKFNINTNAWTSVSTSSTVFTERRSHTATLYNDVIYVIGGIYSSALNTVFKFTIATSVWAQLSSTGFTARYAHTATLHNDNIYVIGGYSGSGYLSDVAKYSTTSNS
jgi:N-acetylneuraminic acid mutarotase